MAEPRLRFKDDNGNAYPVWQEYELDEVLTERNEPHLITKDAPQLSFTIEQGVIYPEDKKTNKRDFLMKDKDNKKFLLTEYNDIIYNPANLKFGAIHRNALGRGVVSPIYAIFYTDQNPAFIEGIVTNPKFIKSSLKYLEGTVVKLMTLKPKDFVKMKVWIPCLEEQQKIADFLSSVDEVIAVSEQEVANLETQKKAVMKKIFSQEVRFKKDDGSDYPEWEETKFGDTVIIERGGSPRPIEQYITEGEGYNWIKIGDAPQYGNYITQTAQRIIPEGLRKTRQVFVGDLILSNSMSFGKPYIMGIDGCIHDGWLLIRNNQNRYNLRYLCYLLGSDYMLKQYKSLAGGSAVNNLNKDLVASTTVFIPCLEEQRLISEFLSNFDEAIAAAKKELELWKEFKKGLLQQMFI